MRKRDKLGLALPPLLLRLLLAGTFIWAGLGKLRSEDVVNAEQAAILANMGVVKPPEGGSAPDPNTPTTPLPTSDPAPKKDENGKPKDNSRGDELTPRVSEPHFSLTSYQPASPGAPATTPPAPPEPAAAGGKPQYTAKDFPEKTTITRVYKLALMMHAGAHPAPRADGTSATAYWPASLAGGRTPTILAWCVAITEIGGGAMLLIGLLTRFWALALAGVMAGAMWLTGFGPAISSGDALLGFLPNRPAFAIAEWTPMFWQLSLLVCSLALFLGGPGLLAADNALFGRDKKHADDDSE